MDKPTYSWSYDEETYHGQFGSIDEAMQAAFAGDKHLDDDGNGRPGVHVGENEPFHPANHLGAEAFIDWAQQQIFEELGEQSEDFLADAPPDQKLELDEFLASWIGRADAGSHYWKIKNSTFHKFADYDLAQVAE